MVPGSNFSRIGGKGGRCNPPPLRSRPLWPLLRKIRKIRWENQTLIDGAFQWAKWSRAGRGYFFEVNGMAFDVVLAEKENPDNRWPESFLYRQNLYHQSKLYECLQLLSLTAFKDLSRKMGFLKNRMHVIESFLPIPVPEKQSDDFFVLGSIGVTDREKKEGRWFLINIPVLADGTINIRSYFMRARGIRFGENSLPLKGNRWLPEDNRIPFSLRRIPIESSFIIAIPTEKPSVPEKRRIETNLKSLEYPVLSVDFMTNKLRIFNEDTLVKVDFRRCPVLFHTVAIGVTAKTTAGDFEAMVTDVLNIKPEFLGGVNQIILNVSHSLKNFIYSFSF